MAKVDAVELAIGRLIRLGSRPFQEGDFAQYEMCRRIILAAVKADDRKRQATKGVK